MSKADYVRKIIGELPDEQRIELVAALLADETTIPETPDIELVLAADYTDDAEALYRNFGRMQGLSSGLAKIDELMKGLVPGELILVAGKTSRGKTMLSLNIANNIAITGKTVLFVTLEMTKPQVTERLLYMNGGNTDAYVRASAHIAYQRNDELDWRSIDPLVEKARSELDVSLVVIDHLHYFTRELENVAEDLGRITKELKKNAVRHSVPIILISHVRKTRDGQEATMEDMRGSSYMGQDADVVLMVGRNDDEPKTTYVKLEKNRNRGVDYEHNIARLFTDKVRLLDNEPIVVPRFPD